MGTSVQEEATLKFIARLDQRAAERPLEALTPAAAPAYPGFEEKMRVMSARQDRGLPLHHPDDVKLPLGMGLEIWVGPNGRIIDKQLVEEDKAGIVVVAPELTQTTIDLVKEEFGPFCPHIIRCEWPEPPKPRKPVAARRAA